MKSGGSARKNVLNKPYDNMYRPILNLHEHVLISFENVGGLAAG